MLLLPKLQFLLLLMILLAGVIIGAKRFDKMDTALQIFYLWFVLVLVNETISFLLLVNNISRNLLSHIYTFFELSLTGIYFFLSVYKKREGLLSVLFCLFAAALCLSDFLFWQRHTYNTIILLVECFLFVCMALFAIFRLFIKEDQTAGNAQVHAKIWIGILLLWSVTFFYWAFLLPLQMLDKKYLNWINIIQVLLNTVVYFFFVLQFYNLKKTKIA